LSKFGQLATGIAVPIRIGRHDRHPRVPLTRSTHVKARRAGGWDFTPPDSAIGREVAHSGLLQPLTTAWRRSADLAAAPRYRTIFRQADPWQTLV